MSTSTPPTQPYMRLGILSSVVDAVGATPLISLSRLAKEEGIKCNILAKVEFFSAGGSIKDRIARRMIQSASLPADTTLIEPTSGNTGIGLALLSSVMGYRCIIVMPEKMSKEKEAVIRGFGAEVVRTKDEEPWDSENSHIGVAKRLAASIPGAVILDQYSNPNNPLAHYHETFAEIQYSIDTAAGGFSASRSKQVDLLVAGAGTGGTITGLSRALRDHYVGLMKVEASMVSMPGSFEGSEVNGHSSGSVNGNGNGNGDAKAQAGGLRPRGRVVAVDPVGSILGGGDLVAQYQVEGIGYDFFPEVLDPSEACVDTWVKTEDGESFEAARKVIRTEGLLVGGSSGSAIAGMLKYLRTTPEGRAIAEDEDANVVVILPDGIRNYIGKDWFLKATLEAEGDTFLKAQIAEVLAKSKEKEGEKLGGEVSLESLKL